MPHPTIEPNSIDLLFSECRNRNLNISVSSQRINDFSIEIYTGYKTTYKLLFYTDGHLCTGDALKEAYAYLITYDQALHS